METAISPARFHAHSGPGGENGEPAPPLEEVDGGERSSREGPAYPHVGVLAFVPDRWGGPWMARHQILTRLSAYFHVAWVEPPREWREMWVEGEEAGGELPARIAADPGFHRVVPGRWLPKLYRPAALVSLLDRLRMRRARDVLRDQGSSEIVLYAWRPDFADALDVVEHDLSLYHVDDDYTFSSEEKGLPPGEERLLTDADRVLIHSPALWDRKADYNPDSIYLPNGVDYDAFSGEAAEPADLKTISGPRVGYVGVIKEQLDLELLIRIARRHPDWSLVLVGPVRYVGRKEEQVLRLRSLPNVHFLGNKRPDELPAYVQHMSVCTLPYEIDDYTRYIDPLKMYEYLAAGRPVVGVPLPSIERHADVVEIASTVDDWSAALEEAIERRGQQDHVAVQRRQAVARRHDWTHLTRRVAKTIAGGLDGRLPTVEGDS